MNITREAFESYVLSALKEDYESYVLDEYGYDVVKEIEVDQIIDSKIEIGESGAVTGWVQITYDETGGRSLPTVIHFEGKATLDEESEDLDADLKYWYEPEDVTDFFQEEADRGAQNAFLRSEDKEDRRNG